MQVLHKPCKGKMGARITISLPHHRQKTSKDNLSILNALINSAGVLDVQRMLGSVAMGQKIGISRIYDRIAWFEQIFLASAAERAGGGGAHVGGSYIPGAVFNPRALISLLNIFRVHYNFLDLRPYATPYEAISAAPKAPVKKVPRVLRIPGTDEWIDLAPKVSKKQERKTPAMRHGLNAHTRRKTGEISVPDLHRLIYRPWLYANTKAGAKLDRSWSRPSVKAMKHRKART